MKRKLLPILIIAAIALVQSNCAARRPDGYRPPPTEDPFSAFTANWAPLETVSGSYGLRFRYADGKKVSLTANMVVGLHARTRIDLSSDRGAEAILILTPELLNMVNLHDKYYVREENNREHADILVGLYLSAEEVAALMSGKGINPERFSQVYADPADGGGVYLRAFHASDNIRVVAYVDEFGRMRNARFLDAATDEPIVAARYLGFRLNGRTGIVWPTVVEIDLLRHGESVRLRAYDVDLNPSQIDVDYVFTPRSRGKRLLLEDVPPGPPLIYRSAKDYVE